MGFTFTLLFTLWLGMIFTPMPLSTDCIVWYCLQKKDRSSTPAWEPWTVASGEHLSSYQTLLVQHLPVLLYGADTWSITITARRRLDALTSGVCHTFSAYPIQPMSQIWQSVSERNRAESLFGHICWAYPSHDHALALQASNCLPEDWQCLSGRPRPSWLRTIEGDLKTQDISLSSEWHITHRHSHWHRVKETAIPGEERATRWWCWKGCDTQQLGSY